MIKCSLPLLCSFLTCRISKSKYIHHHRQRLSLCIDCKQKDVNWIVSLTECKLNNNAGFCLNNFTLSLCIRFFFLCFVLYILQLSFIFHANISVAPRSVQKDRHMPSGKLNYNRILVKYWMVCPVFKGRI